MRCLSAFSCAIEIRWSGKQRSHRFHRSLQNENRCCTGDISTIRWKASLARHEEQPLDSICCSKTPMGFRRGFAAIFASQRGRDDTYPASAEYFGDAIFSQPRAGRRLARLLDRRDLAVATVRPARSFRAENSYIQQDSKMPIRHAGSKIRSMNDAIFAILAPKNSMQ